ncbi:MAG TPA: xanthine dehydrogenase accessory protein XdhC [Burkholderiaceae bacterium]|nr:xanthine dehydrogenase accessory protein XdhC [Burkholderiaceae bacterium]
MFTAPLLETARRWLAEGRAAWVVEVGATQGSVPREAGTRMLVAANEVQGSVGGGHLELQAIATARQRLASGDTEAHEQHIALGPSLGQCCGGVLTLRFAPLDAGALARWPATPPRFHLQLYGAGHVGRAIVRHLEALACRVQWIDERDSEFPAAPLPVHIERVCVEPVEAEVRNAPPQAHYLVLTHSHDLDLRITEAILRRGDFAFLGLIGSRTKRARFVHRFEQRGLAPALLERLTCPIGIPGIWGKEPEVIAVGVVAQLLQQSHATV